MYSFFNRLRGSVTLKISGAQPEAFINECVERGAELIFAAPVENYCTVVTVPSRQLKRVRRAAAASGCTAEIVGCGGAASLGRLLLRRIVPAVCLALCLALLAWSKLFLWEIEVKGAERVSEGEILSALADCGVKTGAFWPSFTSDLIRAEALLKLPELAWLTVNVYGSRAEIVVRERVPVPELIDDRTPADIVAEKSGFVTRMLALAGQEQAAEGSAVLAGETLIAGAVTSALGETRCVRAYGDVTALTYYEMTAAAPDTVYKKGEAETSNTRWALKFGNARINFYNNSSISGVDCDKIYIEHKAELKGLFSLPITLIEERTSDCAALAASGGAEERMAAELLDTLTQSVNGEILRSNCTVYRADGLVYVCLRAECSESIGKTVYINPSDYTGSDITGETG